MTAASGLWWTILVDHVRIGVQAATPDDAFRIFIDKRFPLVKDKVYRTTGRKMPPTRSECSIRQSLPVEVEAFQKRRVLPLTQNTALFDRTSYEPKVTG